MSQPVTKRRLSWERIQQIFDEACQMPPDRRQEYVQGACQGDRTLCLQVESLLFSIEEADDFLEEEIACYAARLATAATPGRVGPYRVVSEIGRGGMGAVYLAERADEQYQRRVAIKLVRTGAASSPELLRRFRRERQILAGLQHPHIAQMLDGGVSEDGTPYLVMEYVEGIRIDEYSKRNQLALGQRIELFRKVCSAVAFAHRNLVVHRDIKPSNILVTGDGVPKLLDFGIAKLLRRSDTAGSDSLRGPETAGVTAPAERLMTREYASPEQIRGLPITTASDVYALGIVLYELLAGRHPFDAVRSDFIALERAVCETDARPPSSVPAVPSGASPAAQLRGDLDSVVLKAIRKEPAERYASVEQLSEDLERYLSGFPVMARRGTRRYRAEKFMRRHRLGIAAAAAFILVLVAFGTGMSLLAARLARERTHSNLEAQQARQAEQTAEAVNQFLQHDILAQASTVSQTGAGPDAKADPDLKVRTAFDRAAAGIEGKFSQQPLIEASIRNTLGQSYANLGLFPQARQQWERCLELRRRFLGEGSPDTLVVARVLADLDLNEGKYAEAERLLQRLVQIDRSSIGPRNPETRSAMYSLGVAYDRQGKLGQAEAMLTEALELSRSISGEMDSETVGLFRDLAQVYNDEGQYRKAEQLFEKTLDLQRRLFGPEYQDILITKMYLSRVYGREGKLHDAAQLALDALSAARRVLGEGHPTTAVLTSALATAYLDEGKYKQAQTLYEKALDLNRGLFGADNPSTLTASSDLGKLYRLQSKFAESEALLTRTLEVRRRVSGEENPSTMRLMGSLALLYDREGKYREAETLLMTASTAQGRFLGGSHPETLFTLSALGRVRIEQRKYVEAEATLRTALEAFRKASPDTWQRYHCESLLGRSLSGQNRFEEAEPLEVSGYRGMSEREAFIAVPDRYLLEEARVAVRRR